MAYGSSMIVDLKNRFRKAGITVEIYPSTVRWLMVELQSASANSTVSSAWQSHLLGPSTGAPLRHTLALPYSTRLTYMRARHPAGQGYSAGPFTPTISARPKLTPDVARPFFMQMTYQGNIETPSGSDIYVTSAKTIKVGTQPTTGTVTKIRRIPYEDGLPDSPSQSYSPFPGYLTPGTSATIGFQAPVKLAPGVKVTKFRIRSYRGISSDEITAMFAKTNSTAGVTNLSTANNNVSTGWVTTTGGAVSETISTASNYYCRINLNPSTGTSANVRFMYWEFEYQMPDYQKGI